jgi:NitT/TauT family transport system substrate-binding protein
MLQARRHTSRVHAIRARHFGADVRTATALAGVALVTQLLTGCAPATPAAPVPAATAVSTPPRPAATPVANAQAAQPLVHLQVALGFVPSVQSAPFYVAQDKGYYAAEGLDVELKYGTIQNLLKLVSDGDVAFASASGDSLIPQRQQGVAITYVLTFWTKSPIGALGLAGNNSPPLRQPADLKGKSVGVSAPNTSTHFGLKALLQSAKLNDDDVKLVAIGTTEVEALVQKRIDAAMTFLPNEAAQMKSLGFSVETIAVGDYLNLVPPGFVVGDKLVAEHPELVQKFVNATLKGLKDTQADPSGAFEASLKRMPELSVDSQPLQRDVLAATLEYYKPVAGRALGSSDPAGWTKTQAFLQSIGVVDHAIDTTQFFNNTFVENAHV